MLRIKILESDPTISIGKRPTHIKITCPSCTFVYSKEAFFIDLWGQYPTICQRCGGVFAPIYHLLNKNEVKILWHRNDGEVEPKLKGLMWAPVTEVVAKTEKGKADD